MADTTIVHDDGDQPASIRTYVDLLVRTLQQVRRVKLQLHRERLRHRHTREVLHEAVTMLRDKDRQLDAARTTIIRLREEMRPVAPSSAEADAHPGVH